MIAFYTNDNTCWRELPVTSTTYLNYDFETTGDTSPFRVPYSASITCRITETLMKVLNLPTHPLSSPTVGVMNDISQRRIFLCFCEKLLSTGISSRTKNPTSCGWAYVSGVTEKDITFSYSDITADRIKDILDQSTGETYGEPEGKKRTLADLFGRFKWSYSVSLVPSDIDSGWITKETQLGYQYPNALGEILHPLLNASYGWNDSVTSTITKNRWHANEYAGGQCTSTLPITLGSINTIQLQPVMPIEILIRLIRYALLNQNQGKGTIKLDITKAPSLQFREDMVYHRYSLEDLCKFHGYGIALPLFTEAISANPNDDLLEISSSNFVPNDAYKNTCPTKYGQLRLDAVESDTDSTYYEFVWKLNTTGFYSGRYALKDNRAVYVFPHGVEYDTDLDEYGHPTQSAVSDGHCYVLRRNATGTNHDYYIHYTHDYYYCLPHDVTRGNKVIHHVYVSPIVNDKPCWFVKDTQNDVWIDANDGTEDFYISCRMDRFESLNDEQTSNKMCANIQPDTWSFYEDSADQSRCMPACVVKGPAHDHFSLYHYLKKTDTPLEYLSRILSYFNVSVTPEYESVDRPDSYQCTFKFFEYNAITPTAVDGTLTSLSPTPYTGSKVVFKADSAKDYLSDTYSSAYPKQPFGSYTFETGIKNCEFNNASDSKAIMPSYCLVKKWTKRTGTDINNPWHYDLGQGSSMLVYDNVMTCAFDKDNKQVDLHNGIFALIKYAGKTYPWYKNKFTYQLVMNTRPDYVNTTDDSPANPNSQLACFSNYGNGWLEYAPNFNVEVDDNGNPKQKTFPLKMTGKASILRYPITYEGEGESRISTRLTPVNAIYVHTIGRGEDTNYDYIVDFTSYGTPKVLFGDFAFNPKNIVLYKPNISEEGEAPMRVRGFNITDRSNWKSVKFKCKVPYGTAPAKMLLNTGDKTYQINVKKLQINPLGDTPDEGEGYLVLTEPAADNNHVLQWNSSTGTMPSGAGVTVVIKDTTTYTTRTVHKTPSDSFISMTSTEKFYEDNVTVDAVAGWSSSFKLDTNNKCLTINYTQSVKDFTINWSGVPSGYTPSLHLYNGTELLASVTYPNTHVSYLGEYNPTSVTADDIHITDETYSSTPSVSGSVISASYTKVQYKYEVAWIVSELPDEYKAQCFMQFNTGESITYPDTSLTTTHKPTAITAVYIPPSPYVLKSVPQLASRMLMQYVRQRAYQVDWTGPNVPQSSSHMVGGTISKNGEVICTYDQEYTTPISDSRDLTFSLPNLQGFVASIDEDAGIIYFEFTKLYSYEVVWNGPFPVDTRILFQGQSVYAPDNTFDTIKTPPTLEKDKHLEIVDFGSYIAYAYATVNTDYLRITATASSAAPEQYEVIWSPQIPASQRNMVVVWREEDVALHLTQASTQGEKIPYCIPDDMPPLSGNEFECYPVNDTRVNGTPSVSVDTVNKKINVNWT